MKQLWKSSLFWIVVFFGILTTLFFYQTVISHKIPVPADALVGLYHPWRDAYASTNPRGVPFKNFLITDPVRQQIPWRKIAMTSWMDGKLPTWNAYSFAGTRLDSNIQAAVYYPLNFIFFILNFVTAWTILVMLQPFIAGVGLFVYLRHHKLSLLASMFGAVSWAFGGFSIAWLTWGTIMQTAMWLPMILLCLDHLMQSRISRMDERRWMLAIWVFVFLLMSAGHSQIALYGLMVAGLYALRLYNMEKFPQQARKALLSRLGLLGIVGACITIPIWLPQWNALALSVRATQESHPEGWFLPWQHVIQFVAPDFFGNPATMNYWGVWNYGEFIGYIGIVSFVFGLSAMFSGPMALFWSWMFVGALFFMIGHPITHALSATHIPLLGSLQPTRLMMLAVLALSVLVAYGVDGWRRSSRHITYAVVFIGMVIGLLWSVAYAGPELLHISDESWRVALRNLVVPTLIYIVTVVLLRGSRFIPRSLHTYILIVLFAISVVDIFRFGWKFTPFTDVAYFFPKTRVIEFLQKQPRPFRIASVDDRVLPSNVSAYYEIESIGGYDPLALLRYENFLTASERNKPDLTRPTGFNRIYTPHNISSSLFPLFSAQYILSIDELHSAGLRLVFEEGQTKVYENLLALPRVYLAERIDVVTNPTAQNVLEKIFDSIKVLRPAVVESVLPVLSLPLGGDESVSITSYAANKMIMRSHTTNPRLLVVLNTYDDNWRATIDGVSASVVRVNYLFLGLVVPAGSHEVTLIH